MSNSRDQWLNEQLRNVQLPDELLARLKKISRASDDELDAAIRDVAVPEGLLAQLKRVPGDAAFDRRLAAVDVPVGLTERLREVPQYADAHLDAELNEVELPAGLGDSLRAISRSAPTGAATWRRSAVVYWAVAASLMIAVGLSFFSALTVVAESVYLANATTEPGNNVTLESYSTADEWWYGPHGTDDAPGRLLASVAEIEVEVVLPAEDAGRLPRSRVAEVDRLFRKQGSSAEGLLDVFMQSTNLFAFGVSDTQYELTTASSLEPRGIAPPAVKGFDLVALLRDGVHPFASPGEHAELRTSRIPLVTSIDSFDFAQQAIAAGRLPEPSQVRVEEFLAAMEYDFAPPRSGEPLAIRTAAGPSPLGEQELQLLQVGVQAAQPVAADEPTHVTLAIDTSASMHRGGQFRAVRRGVGQLVAGMSDRDRLSIVVFGEHAQTIVEDARREDAATVIAALRDLPPNPSTNIAAGLQWAAATSLGSEASANRRRRLVLMTDGLQELSQATFDQLTDLVAQIDQSGATLHLVDVAASDSRPGAAQWSRLAALAGGRVVVAQGGAAIGHAAIEILTGKTPVLAVDAQLTVKFNPDTVARYRLLGHEADAMGGLVAGPESTTLYAGQTATALYELELNPYGGDDVATATVVWRDPESGETNRIGPQRISRLQFATSMLESPISLQRAALAAAAAEVLRRSPFSGNLASGLQSILETSAELPPAALADPTVGELISLVGQAEQIRSGRPFRRGTPPLYWLRPR